MSLTILANISSSDFRQGSDYVHETIHSKISTLFYLLMCFLVKGHVHKLEDSLFRDAILNKFKLYHQNKLSNFSNFSRICLLFMKNRNLKQTTVLLNAGLNDANIFQPLRERGNTLNVLVLSIVA